MSHPRSQQLVELPGSERKAVVGARKIGDVDPTEYIEISVYLKPRATLPPAEEFAAGGARPLLSREELATQYGADPDAMARVMKFAHAHHLSVVEEDASKRL